MSEDQAPYGSTSEQMSLQQAWDVADQAYPMPALGGAALRTMRAALHEALQALSRIRDAAGLPPTVGLLDIDQAVADLRRRAEGRQQRKAPRQLGSTHNAGLSGYGPTDDQDCDGVPPQSA